MAIANLTYYLFLVLALGLGWGIAWISFKPRLFPKRTTSDIYHDYFVGLNYLLGNEPDEALDTFIRALEVNGDNFESHLALGTLLRRRGKVDKAIKVHQALLTKTDSQSPFSETVRLELAKDYIASGLLDRAERLLSELVHEYSDSKPEALLQLTTVYLIEKEWEKAIDVVSALIIIPLFKKDKSIRGLGAHFCCELAEHAIASNQLQPAREQVKRAFRFDRTSVRASFVLAKIEQRSGNFYKAIDELERIANQAPEYLSELVKPLAECYDALHDSAELYRFEDFLRASLKEKSRASVLLKLTELVHGREGADAATTLLFEGLKRSPSLKCMVELLRIDAMQASGQLQENLLLIGEELRQFSRSKPGYHCEQCGFESKNLYWQCPSCKKWDSIKPWLGIDGE